MLKPRFPSFRSLFLQSGLLSFLLLCLGSCTDRSYYVCTEHTQSITIRDSLGKDSIAEAIIVPYRAFLDEKMSEVIGYSKKELTKDLVESPLGNFAADALRSVASKHYGKEVDLAVVTIGGLRSPLPKGKIHMSDAYELMPFDNNLVVLTVNGEVLYELFGYMRQKCNVGISNAKILYRKTKFVYALINGKPLEAKKKYTLAISDYLANGGDEMFFLRDAEKTTQTLPLMVREAIIEYIRDLTAAGKKIDAEVEYRFMIKNSF